MTYTFTATNNGNVTLTNVTIVDPLPGLSALSCTQPATLAPGESLVCTATYSITQSDLDNGTVMNTATADSDEIDPVDDSETVTAVQTPVLNLTKVADVMTYDAVGDIITYTFTATNNGNVTLTNVTIVDPLPGLSALSCTQPATLAPGESLVCTATYSITQSDLDIGSVMNTATADSDQTDPVDDSETVTAVQTPVLNLTKVADVMTYDAVGDIITYTFTATNNSNVTLTNVTIVDPLPGLSALSCTQPATLAPGESLVCMATYSITQSDLDNGTVMNTATADSDETDPVDDSETVTAVQTPVLNLTKIADVMTYDEVGDIITYTFTATNNGNVTLTNVTIVDPLPGLSALSCTQPATLAPGESLVCTATYSITQTDLDNGSVMNTATADSDETDPVDDSETVTAVQTPVLNLTKIADVMTYDAVGDIITYTFTATNNGNVTLTNVTIVDPLPGLSALACTQPATLAPGESLVCTATYTISQTDLDIGSVMNTATADSDQTDPVDDSETVIVDGTPLLDLTKVADVMTYDAVSDVITYTFTATNLGNVTLTNVTITDPLPGLSALSCTQPATLGPGESLICTATYSITQADLDNGLVVNTATADSDETDPVNDSETVTAIQSNQIMIVKESVEDTYDMVGDVINYTLAVTNTGNTTIYNVVVTDPDVNAGSIVYTGGDNGNGALDVGETWNYTAQYTIEQSDLDNGSFTNTASVTGSADTDGDGTGDTPVNDDDDDIVTAIPDPSLSLMKTADVATYDAVGDVITYTFVATNDGNVTLNNVTISDPLPGLSALDCTQPVNLAPGESLTCTATYTITQADLDAGSVVNTATADSDDTDPVEDDETVTADQMPVLSISKTADVATYDAVGDVITYTFVATNDGNVTLNNVTISDPLPGLSALACTQPINLAPGESLTCTATYTITQADLDAGSVVNTATADSDETDPVEDDETVTADQMPLLSLSKTADVATYDAVGDVITYTFVATNDGNVTLNNVTISDPLPGLSALDCTQPVNLAPGASLTCTATYAITQSDLDAGSVVNTATADSDETDPVEDDETVTADGMPVLSLSKTADVTTYNAVGDVITYTFVATNEGNVALTNVTISDPLPGLSTLDCTQPVNLAPGESLTCTATYTITQADLDAGSVVNTATADSDETDPVEDDETVTADQMPVLSISKTADVATYDAVGDVITYTFVATNDGNVTLNNVTISDPLPGLSALACTQPVNLAPGESLTCTATYTITQADLDAGSVINTATADSDETDPVEDDETVTADGMPVLSLSKTADVTTYNAVGDVITYTFVATNDGNVTLNNVTISDPLPGLSALDCTQPVNLAPGASLTCTATYAITQSDLDAGSVVNTATADSDETDPVEDDETVTADGMPVLSLSKTADVTTYNAVGDVITYTFVATNEGNVAITNVTISDPLPGLSALDCTQPVNLAPGESLTCTATYTITQADLDAGSVVNTATADSDETDPVEDDETVTADQMPVLTLSKTADVATYDAVGDVITYTFVATNNGNVTLNNVTISDPLPGLSALDCTQPVNLAPGESLTCTATYTITQADLDAGSVVNTATADSDETDPVEDDETVTADGMPVLSLSKTADVTTYNSVGDVITYTFVATNEGNVALTNVTISDPLPGLSALDCTQPVNLAPGESLTCTATYTITQADLDAGSVVNTATADSDETDPVEDDETVTADQMPVLSLSKTADVATYDAVGDVITYTFVATNEGNVALTNVTISDPLPGLSALDCTQPINLAPGESLTCTATYTITQADLDAGSVVNMATADSDETDPVEDNETVDATEDPSISLIKTSSFDILTGVITYTYTVTNTGNVTLTNVMVVEDDVLFSGTGVNPIPIYVINSSTMGSPEGTLLVGESAEYTATYLVTPEDYDAMVVINQAEAVGESPNGEMVNDLSDFENPLLDRPTETPVEEMDGNPINPSIALIKTSAYSMETGEITYTYLVTNTGDAILTMVAVTEDILQFTGTGSLPTPTYVVGSSSFGSPEGILLPGESANYTAVYTVTEADYLAGSVTNQADATGQDPNGDPVEDQSDYENNFDDRPTVTSVPQDCDSELVCSGQLNVNLQEDCTATLTKESAVPGFDCEVIIIVEDEDGLDNIVNGCGTYKYTVTATDDPNNNCWGYITAEDKEAPVCLNNLTTVTGWDVADYGFRDFVCDDIDQLLFNTPESYKLTAQGDLIEGSFSSEFARQVLDGVTGYMVFTDNCGNITVTVSDEVDYGTDPNCDQVTITRTFSAVDECGEPSEAAVCTQTIVITKPGLEDVYCPDDAELDCSSEFTLDANGNPHPDVTGYPFIETAFDTDDLDGDEIIWEKGIAYLDGTVCNLGASYTDGERIEVCTGTYKFIRTWEILDWCAEGEARIRECKQVIKVGDFSKPVVACAEVDYDNDGSADLRTYSTGPYDCTAAFQVPMPLVEDNCSDWEVLTEVLHGSTTGPVIATILPGASRYVSGIPLGCHFIKYTVTDACGNEEIVFCPFLVEDLIEPIAVCNDDLNVSIGGQGLARVFARDIDEGSSDNCGPVRIEVRRRILDPETYECLDMFDTDGDGEIIGDEIQLSVQFGDPDGTGSGEEYYYTAWKDYVDFTCCDMDGHVRVELRVWDDRNGDGIPGNTIERSYCDANDLSTVRDNSNVCWMDLLIEDKLPAYCVPPLPASIACDELPLDFDPTNAAQMTELFGAATGTDNCPGYTVEELAPLTDGLSDCGYGTLVRRFQVYDAKGLASTNKCEQVVTVKERHHYKIKFPKDAEAVCGTPDPDTLITEEIACDLLAVSVKDDFFSASGDECYKIFRTYSIINWCEYDGISDPVVVNRDEDCDGQPGDEDVWVIVETMNETDPCHDNYGGVPASDYSHVWYDRDSDPFNLIPAAGTKGESCEYESNPAGFWKEVAPLTDNSDSDNYPEGYYGDHCDDMASVGYWRYTQVIKVYDNIRPIVAFEDLEPFCSYSSDIDNDCPAEISINFTIEENCTPDDLTITIFLDAFNDGILEGNITDQLTGTYPNYTVTGTFPLGAHALGISVKDGCGNQIGTNIPFEVVDCKAPAPICINGLAVELMPVSPAADVDGDGDDDTGAMTIWASDFIASPMTDCSGEVTYSINRQGDQISADQTGLVLTCDDASTVLLEIWAWDALGNGDLCETYVLVQDNMVQCDNNDIASVAGYIETEETVPVEGVMVELSGNQFQTMNTKADGHYLFEGMETGFDYTITPQHDIFPLNGVTTFDLVLMSKHVLGTEPLDSPYKRIAADVNRDGRVTAIDAIALRRLILNISARFETNTSWRFIPAAYVFPDPQNPWLEEFPELININDLQGSLLEENFIAVKVGDINLSARANALELEERGARGMFFLDVSDQDLKAGNSYRIDFRADQIRNIQGYQFTLDLDPAAAVITDVAYGVAQAEHFGVKSLSEGLLATSWNTGGANSNTLDKETVLFSLNVTAKRDVRLSEILGVTSRITPAEAYNQDDGLLDVGIDFNNGSIATTPFELHQNSPNPFRRETTIGFHLPESGETTLSIHDAGGRVIKLIRGEFARGSHQIQLKREEIGSTGVLYYTLTSGAFTATRKMIVVE
ncbi:DUF7507 domain-containing protein [Flavilitoribacter nigricans]|uniref:DUF7507 domain-containing protein n=1 Tax=Flavilitoribacter nigricans TaxID=70997 RepID=UPI0021CFB30E|nr:dockerin type I domain-containing protein [Flavilitoribacter nigricans]